MRAPADPVYGCRKSSLVQLTITRVGHVAQTTRLARLSWEKLRVIAPPHRPPELKIDPWDAEGAYPGLRRRGQQVALEGLPTRKVPHRKFLRIHRNRDHEALQ